MKRNLLFILVAVLYATTTLAYDNTYTVATSTTEIINITATGDYLIQGDGTLSKDNIAKKTQIVVAENLGNITITLKSVFIYPNDIKKDALLINAGSNVRLILDGVNHLQGKSSHAGICVLGSVAIEAANNGAAVDSLYTQGSNAPGIGGFGGNAVGDITINSGSIVCNGTSGSAGLGTGQGGGSLHNITINGGKVTCYNSGNGAGIGCGENCTGFNKIEINGGVVTATGGTYCAGIGGTNNCGGDSIVINGGTIIAKGGSGAASGIGAGAGSSTVSKQIVTGGNIQSITNAGTIAFTPAPVNAEGTALEVFACQLADVKKATLITSGNISGTDYNITLGTNYGINDVYTDATGNLWFYLPAAPADAEAVLNTVILNPANTINIDAAGNYTIKGNGTQTNKQIVVAADLGNVTLALQNLNILCDNALQVGAGSNVTLNLKGTNILCGASAGAGIETAGNVTINAGTLICKATGTTAGVSGTGSIIINGGTHVFQGTPSIGCTNITINGGSIKTMNATGNVVALTNAKNTAAKTLQLYTCSFTPSTLIKNGNITGTDYSVKLKTDYGITDVYTDETGNLWFYIPATVPGDAVAEFNTMETIDLTTTNETINITEAGNYMLIGGGLSARTGYQIIVADNIEGDVNITLKDVYIKPSGNGSAIVIGNGSNVYITLENENRLDGRSSSAGLEVIGNVTLDGTGSLTTIGDYAPGIGSKSNLVGNITINGGTFVCTGGTESAGIGGGNGTSVSNITINGGYITATGGFYSPGIGTGIYGKGANNNADSTRIVINGGTIVATANVYTENKNVAIGRGKSSSEKMTIVINGGTIKTLSSDKVITELYYPAAKNSAGVELKLFQCSLEGATEATAIANGNIGSIVLGTDYGINDVMTEENGALYFYLPEQVDGVEVKLNQSPITSLTGIDNSNIRVSGFDNIITISNATGKQMRINDITGKCIQNCIIKNDIESRQLPQGFYLVTIANEKTFKVIIK